MENKYEIKDVYLRTNANVILELRKEGWSERKIKLCIGMSIGCPSQTNHRDCKNGRGSICQGYDDFSDSACDYQPYDKKDWEAFMKIMDKGNVDIILSKDELKFLSNNLEQSWKDSDIRECTIRLIYLIKQFNKLKL